MFVGAIPKEIVEQAIRVIRIDEWREVHVCCSGSFRIERALLERFPKLKVHSNDVSLLTCAVGKLASGDQLRIEFNNALGFVEDTLADRDGPHDRAAAVLVALEMAKFTGPSKFAKTRFTHYVEHFGAYLDTARIQLSDYLDGLSIDSFFPGDFREHAKRAVERGAAIVAWPPTYKGGYERLYKFLKANTSWDEPSYDMFDPNDLPAWVQSLRDSGAQFWVGSDRQLPGLEPAFAFFSGRNRPVFAYATAKETSIRARSTKTKPFKYTPVDTSKLTEASTVKLVPLDSQQMSFLKDKYLALGLEHVNGMYNVAVYVDNMLAGGFIYARDTSGRMDAIYLLSDFSLSRERRLSKLIAMLAASEVPVRAFDRVLAQRSKLVKTTAFTTKPVSMKYRGIYELHARKPGFLQYNAAVKPSSPDEVYREWWKRYGARPE